MNEEISLDSYEDYLDYLEEVSQNILSMDWHYDFHVKTNLNIN